MNYPYFHVVIEITENVFTKPFPLLYFVTAECNGQNLVIDYSIKKWLNVTDVVSGSTECVSAYLKNLLIRNTLIGIVISVYYKKKHNVCCIPF